MNPYWMLLLAVVIVAAVTLYVQVSSSHLTPEESKNRLFIWFGIFSGIAIWHWIWSEVHPEWYSALSHKPIFWGLHVVLFWAYGMQEAAGKDALLARIRQSVMTVSVFAFVVIVWKELKSVSEPVRNWVDSQSSAAVAGSVAVTPSTSVAPVSSGWIPCRDPKPNARIIVTEAGSDTVPVGLGCPWKVYPDVWEHDHTVTTMNEYREVTSITHRSRTEGGYQQRNGVIVRFITVKLDEPGSVRFTVKRSP